MVVGRSIGRIARAAGALAVGAAKFGRKGRGRPVKRRRSRNVRRRKGGRGGRKKRKSENSQLATGADVSGLTINKPRRKLSRYSKLLGAPDYYVLNGSTRVTSSIGKQSATTIGQLYNAQDFAQMYSQVTPLIYDSKVKSLRLNHQYATVEYTITNSSSGTAQVWIYDIMPRRDTRSTDSYTYYPELAWNSGLTDTYLTGVVNQTNTMYGSTPFQSQIFTTWYKVKKVTKLTLGAGVTHRHVVKYGLNRVINNEMMNNITAGNTTYGFGNLTYQTMIVLAGSPAHDVGGAGPYTTSNTSIAQCALDIVWKKRFKFQMVEHNVTTYYAAENLVTTLANETIFTEAGVPELLTTINAVT